MSQLKPKYQHDCAACQFLGQSLRRGRIYDLYICPSDIAGATVIARLGDEGPDYLSHPVNVIPYVRQHSPAFEGSPLNDAYKLAEKRGLINET